LSLLEAQQKISGNTTRDVYSDQGPVSIDARLQAVTMGTFRSTYGPTPSLLRSLEIAESEFAPLKDGLMRIGEEDLPQLRLRLNQAGVPWTPGRIVPSGD
jgi:hypothetical protein